MHQRRLIVFLKAPRPGFVKTRLAQSLGDEGACQAYRRLVNQLFAQIAPLNDVELRFAPDDAGEEIKEWLKPNWRAVPQGGGTLGERLSKSFAEAFKDGCGRVVAIGSDCPDVTAADVAQAWEALETQDVVLGPATDGGYWLIGLREHCEGIFEQIDWSTSRVFEQTMRWIKGSGKSYHLLRELADVDTEGDWKEFLRNDESPRMTRMNANL